MMDFSLVKEITIPEGVVVKITCGVKTLWEKSGLNRYTNLFSTSDPDYSVGRLNSSGAVNTSFTGGFVSGFIPVTFGTDVIRAKGSTAFGSNYGCIAFYKADKTFINQGYITTEYVTISADGKEIMIDTSDMASSIYGESAYFRIMGYGSAAEFVITKNEVIQENLDYLNLVTQPGAYVKKGYRYSLSGGGFKTCTTDDSIVVPILNKHDSIYTIRVRGGSIAGCVYYGSIYFGATNTAFTASIQNSVAGDFTYGTDENGDVVYVAKTPAGIANYKYMVIHVAAGVDESSLIVTINEPII